MRIQVDCRRTQDGRIEPRSFLLGAHRLWVLRILERDGDALVRRFTVCTTDGRRFRLEQDRASGEWQLAAAFAPAA